MLGNEPRHASGLRTSDTGQPLETDHPETTHLTATRSCEACAAFTRVAARTLAPSPICDALHRRLQPFRHLHDCSGCFRLERSPGGACTHWKAPPSHGARKQRTFATVSQTPVVAAADVEEAVARHWPRGHPARHKSKTVTWRVAFAAFQAGRPIRRNPRYRPALKLQIQSRPFPFWSPTGLSNCGHFLCGLNCDGDGVERAKSARKLQLENAHPEDYCSRWR